MTYNVTRNYYVPKNQIGRFIINRMIDKVGCSVEGFKINKETNTICITMSFNDKDTYKIEKILKMYGAL